MYTFRYMRNEILKNYCEPYTKWSKQYVLSSLNVNYINLILVGHIYTHIDISYMKNKVCNSSCQEVGEECRAMLKSIKFFL